ncbi:MAG: hypothetical protein KAS64_11910, partial [Spirochaetes bacterium]|nr:hypothetical protein [Spirochaetota bacterium]
PTEEKAMFEKAKIQEKLKNYGAAGKLYKHLAKHAKDENIKNGAKFRIAGIYLKWGNKTLALGYLKDIAESGRTEVAAKAGIKLGMYYYKMRGNRRSLIKKAYGHFIKVVYLFNKFKKLSAKACYYASKSQMRLGSKIRAITLINRLLRKYPGTTWSKLGIAFKKKLFR